MSRPCIGTACPKADKQWHIFETANRSSRATPPKIGTGSVVLDPVPPHCTVAGVPAKIVARAGIGQSALEMDQMFPHEHEAGSGI